MAAVNPYLHFGGNCEEAFKFYHSVFGGEAPTFSRFKEAPQTEHTSESEGELIMHVDLRIGETVLMGSDRPGAMGPNVAGNNFSVSVLPESEEEATRIFEGLAAGGEITMPLQKTFWEATFGMLTDKFGIHWMVNYQEG